ncbi:MAG TPA: N,N-dimethylformamidase beta subunit family domain-containing protein [Bryobacteraceae bacterium]|nr:N,N-dimethylformamidase beta subunit family domain-containing protein [Bryobacteraceae bacterium]
MYRRTAKLFFALIFVLPAFAETPANLLQQAFGVRSLNESPLLSKEFPSVSLLLVNHAVEVKKRRGVNDAELRAEGSEAILLAHFAHEGAFDICRIRHKSGTPVPADELKLIWSFPMAYNESMTLDAGALEGHPLYLPDGSVPPAHFLNWGTLFYDRADNLALGTDLEGARPAASRWNMRTGPTGPTQLHFWTQTGRPDLALTIFAYRPRNQRLWWAEWYQEQERRSPGTYPGLFPEISTFEISWAPREQQKIEIVPGPSDAGKEMEFVVIDDVRSEIVARRRFVYEMPVTDLTVSVGDWPSGLYRAIVVPAGAKIDPTVRQFNQKIVSLIVRPPHPRGKILFMAPTDMWRAYASNGGHAMTSWRDGTRYTSAGYSPTVLNTRFRRTNHYYYGLYERHSDIQHYQFLHELAEKEALQIDYCTQDDIALDRVHLSDYRLVLVGSHAEFTTRESYLRFRDYLAHGGAVMIHGGDSFAVMVEYLPSLRDRRYIWQRDHIWCHLTDQSDEFMPPRLLSPDAPVTAPITAPEAGDAIDYLNVFHVTVGYWPAGSGAVVSNVDHPVIRGLGLKIGDPVPGVWAGEADMTYEPGSWDILMRSEAAVTEANENGLERVKQPAFHHVGLAIHRNLRLALISSESFTTRLLDPQSTLFREVYVRTLHYLLDPAVELGDGEALAARELGNEVEFTLTRPTGLTAIQYEVPDLIHYDDPLWFRKPAPYAHYIVEGSDDGVHWRLLADRTHGPWRGLQTDFLPAKKLLKLRLKGTISNGEPFRVKNLKAFHSR